MENRLWKVHHPASDIMFQYMLYMTHSDTIRAIQHIQAINIRYSDIILELSSIPVFYSKEGHIGLGWSNGVHSYVRLKGQGIVCTMSGRDFQREQLGLKPCQ